MKKRLFGVLVAIVLLLCVSVPLAVMADATELDWIEISGIEVPQEGAMPSTEGIEIAWPVHQQGSLVSAGWYFYDGENGYTEVTGPFITGEYYYLTLVFELPEGVEFGDMTSYTFPPEVDSFFVWGNELELEFHVPGKPIDAVYANGIPETIAAGQQASVETITIPEDANYTLDVYWQVYGEYGWEIFEGVFEEGQIYRLYFDFYPVIGYEMNTADMYFNGEEAEWSGQSSGWIGGYLMFPLTQEIEIVELINMQVPAVGDTADLSALTVPEDANYEIDYAYWCDENTGEEFTGQFAKGGRYNLQLRVTPKVGCHFAEDLIFTINGEEQSLEWYDVGELYYYETVSFEEVIETVNVIGVVEPVIGQAPVTEGITAENCDIYCLWTDQEGMEVEVFQDRNRYVLEINIYPHAGYRFDYEITQLTVEGEPVGRQGMSENYAYVRLTYSFCETIPEVTVKLPAVEVGQPMPLNAEVPEGANYYTAITWFTWDRENSYMLCEGGNFEAGKMYNMDLTVYPKDGYGFDPAITQVTFIGDDPTCTISESEIYCMRNYDFTSSEKIGKIELTVPAPVLGQPATTAGIAAPADANYIVSQATWMETSEDIVNLVGATWSPAETFRAGMHYVLLVQVTANPGYAFEWKAPVYVNGEEVEVLIYGGDGMVNCMLPIVYEPLADAVGDINGSGSATNDDVIALMWHVLFPEENPIAIDGDLNKDGSVDNNDVIALMWYILFPDDYPL